MGALRRPSVQSKTLWGCIMGSVGSGALRLDRRAKRSGDLLIESAS